MCGYICIPVTRNRFSSSSDIAPRLSQWPSTACAHYIYIYYPIISYIYAGLNVYHPYVHVKMHTCDEESLLVLLRHGSRNRSDCPAQRVEVVPRPLGAIDLVLELVQHDVLRVVVVEVGQVDERLKAGDESSWIGICCHQSIYEN